MGIKERRERERQERQLAIVEATRAIAAREGWQATTIRRVADELELSAPTIYEHFASKDALLHELLSSGYRRCLDVMVLARSSTEDPTLALVRMGQAYWDEAWSSPELYQVMYGLGGVAFTAFALPPEAGLIHDEVVAAMLALEAPDRAEAAGLAALAALAEQRAQLFRAMLHGLVTLVMAGRLAGAQERAADLVEPAIRSIIGRPST